MFGPLKWKWDKVLNDHMGLTAPKNSIRRSNFVNMVSEMWHDAMPSKNAVSGFECTGIYPVDRSKYLLDRLDESLLNKYDEWLKAGKPVDTTEANTAIIQLPELLEQPPSPEETWRNWIYYPRTYHQQRRSNNIDSCTITSHWYSSDSASSTTWLQVAISSMLITGWYWAYQNMQSIWLRKDQNNPGKGWR